MKRTLILLSLLVAAISLNAQTYSTKMVRPRGENYFIYNGAAGDTIYGTGGQSFDFQINMNEPYFFDIYFDVDTLLVAASNPDIVFQLSGSNDDVTYYNIGSSLRWYGTFDTIVRFNNFSKTIADVNTVASYTITAAAHNINTGANLDTIGINADTLYVPAVASTVASHAETHAVTETENAVIWRFLRLTGTGQSGARAELEKAVFAIIPKRYQ